jgi:hypothetical protein
VVSPRDSISTFLTVGTALERALRIFFFGTELILRLGEIEIEQSFITVIQKRQIRVCSLTARSPGWV